jgi:hypothetical protein
MSERDLKHDGRRRSKLCMERTGRIQQYTGSDNDEFGTALAERYVCGSRNGCQRVSEHGNDGVGYTTESCFDSQRSDGLQRMDGHIDSTNGWNNDAMEWSQWFQFRRFECAGSECFAGECRDVHSNSHGSERMYVYEYGKPEYVSESDDIGYVEHLYGMFGRNGSGNGRRRVSVFVDRTEESGK